MILLHDKKICNLLLVRKNFFLCLLLQQKYVNRTFWKLSSPPLQGDAKEVGLFIFSAKPFFCLRNFWCSFYLQFFELINLKADEFFYHSVQLFLHHPIIVSFIVKKSELIGALCFFPLFCQLDCNEIRNFLPMSTPQIPLFSYQPLTTALCSKKKKQHPQYVV